METQKQKKETNEQKSNLMKKKKKDENTTPSSTTATTTAPTTSSTSTVSTITSEKKDPPKKKVSSKLTKEVVKSTSRTSVLDSEADDWPTLLPTHLLNDLSTLSHLPHLEQIHQHREDEHKQAVQHTGIFNVPPSPYLSAWVLRASLLNSLQPQLAQQQDELTQTTAHIAHLQQEVVDFIQTANQQARQMKCAELDRRSEQDDEQEQFQQAVKPHILSHVSSAPVREDDINLM